MAKKQQRKGIEWVGGLVPVPARVMEGGEPLSAEALFWMGSDGFVHGHAMGRAGEVLASANASLRAAIERAALQRQAPSRLRVASPELAATLREGHSNLDIVCAPTPELDDVIAALDERFADDEAYILETYLSDSVEPEAVRALFEAAAALYRAAPWDVVPQDENVLSLTVEALGVREAALCIMGHGGESFGVVSFESIEDFEDFMDASAVAERVEPERVPPHVVLEFESEAALAPALRREIAEHRWAIASPEAYPTLVVVNEDLTTRAPSAREVTLAEVLATAIPDLIRDRAALTRAFDSGEPLTRTFAVQTHAGELAVTLRIPYEAALSLEPPYDVVGALRELAAESVDIDPELRDRLEQELLRRFLAAPEAQTLEDHHHCELLINLAAAYSSVTLVTLDAPILAEILFELIPRKVGVGPEEARPIVDSWRAFFVYLQREFSSPEATACLSVLAGDAVQRLEAALADSGRFGPAKALVMAGREERPRVPAGRPPLSKATARAKKDKRKAARKARKKNR